MSRADEYYLSQCEAGGRRRRERERSYAEEEREREKSVTPKSFLALLGHGGFAALHLAPVLLVLLASLAFLALGFDEALHRESERDEARLREKWPHMSFSLNLLRVKDRMDRTKVHDVIPHVCYFFIRRTKPFLTLTWDRDKVESFINKLTTTWSKVVPNYMDLRSTATEGSNNWCFHREQTHIPLNQTTPPVNKARGSLPATTAGMPGASNDPQGMMTTLGEG
ncbi:hypothetical protein C1H46_004020 [Malus baccata]|uniref:Uncharacterized protein n=1 Tax=Malus baccata TaxID=106549 RepID=A0A540NIJ7_MALBA|nr:hypothetical protein C1H46_004020 [Malus baccata]